MEKSYLYGGYNNAKYAWGKDSKVKCYIGEILWGTGNFQGSTSAINNWYVI